MLAPINTAGYYITIGSIVYQLYYDKSNGDVQLSDFQLHPFGTKVFVNGKFTPEGKQILQNGGKSEKDVFDRIESDINSAFKAAGGTNAKNILPSWVNPSHQLPVAPPDPNSNIFAVILNPRGAIDNISNQFDSKGDDLLKKYKLLKYPNDILENSQDTLKITQYRYSPPGKNIFKDPRETLIMGANRGTARKEPLSTVILPIPNHAQDSNNTGWGPDSINNLSAALTGDVMGNMMEYSAAAAAGAAAKLAGTAIPDYMKLDPRMAAVSAILGSVGPGSAVKALALGRAAASGALLHGNPNTSLATAATSLILGMGGLEIPPESILSRAGGFVPNNNLELLFSGPSLRQFNFAYRLSPRSKKEATTIKRIIRFFKQGMAARKQSSISGSGQSYFLGTPNVFELEYMSGGDQISGMNKFKMCALTGFDVTYTPEGKHIAYEAGQPASYTIAMSFAELEPIYESDYSDNPPTGKDLYSVGIDDVGY